MKTIFTRHLFSGVGLFLLMLWHALIPVSASATTPHTSRPDFAAIDAYVLSQMDSLHIPGVALGIVHGNQVVHLRGFGIADPAGRPVTPQTPFSISSMTKSFTALAIMQLVEQGKVALDAPVQRYLPWFRVATQGASGKITVRELLNHTSGIPQSAGRVVLAGTGNETMEQAVQTLSTIDLFAPPGTAFQYNNIDYVALGLIVQVASGQSYETYVQQHIFAPLQMHNSFTLTSQDKTTHNGMATGYRWLFGLPFPSDYRNLPEDISAGGILTSAEDMTHYLIAQLNSGNYGSASVLLPASIAVLHRPVVFPSSTAKQYAMGWYALPVDGESILFHTGDDPNFHADMALLPQSQWGVVVLRNANSSELADLTQPYLYSIPAGVIDLLLGQQPHASGLGLDTIFLIIDAMMCILSLLALWSAIRLIRGWQRPLKRTPASLLWGLVLPLLWEVALPIGIFIELPKLAGASWAVALLFWPDFSFWMLGMFALLLITGMARIARIVWLVLRSRRKNRGTSPVLA